MIITIIKLFLIVLRLRFGLIVYVFSAKFFHFMVFHFEFVKIRLEVRGINYMSFLEQSSSNQSSIHGLGSGLLFLHRVCCDLNG